MGINMSRVRLSVALSDTARLTLASRPRAAIFGTKPAVEMVTRRFENPNPADPSVITLAACITLR